MDKVQELVGLVQTAQVLAHRIRGRVELVGRVQGLVHGAQGLVNTELKMVHRVQERVELVDRVQGLVHGPQGLVNTDLKMVQRVQEWVHKVVGVGSPLGRVSRLLGGISKVPGWCTPALDH